MSSIPLTSVPAPVLGLFLVGCTVASLPPTGSRTDGGPVSARGTITHEARSQLRLYRDAAGCESVQTVNRQFRLTRARAPGSRDTRRLVLEESYDVRHCLQSESSSSEAVITAWAPDSGSADPVFRLTGRGVTGESDGPLYRMVARGCCGSQDLGTYFSLVSGRTLMTSSRPVIRLEGPGPGDLRLAGFHDSHSAGPAYGADLDSTVIGVLYWSDDERPLRRLIVKAANPEGFALEELLTVRGTHETADTLVSLTAADSVGLGLVVRLVSPATDRRIELVVPIRDHDLDHRRARLPPGITLSEER